MCLMVLMSRSAYNTMEGDVLSFPNLYVKHYRGTVGELFQVTTELTKDKEQYFIKKRNPISPYQILRPNVVNRRYIMCRYTRTPHVVLHVMYGYFNCRICSGRSIFFTISSGKAYTGLILR